MKYAAGELAMIWTSSIYAGAVRRSVEGAVMRSQGERIARAPPGRWIRVARSETRVERARNTPAHDQNDETREWEPAMKRTGRIPRRQQATKDGQLVIRFGARRSRGAPGGAPCADPRCSRPGRRQAGAPVQRRNQASRTIADHPPDDGRDDQRDKTEDWDGRTEDDHRRGAKATDGGRGYHLKQRTAKSGTVATSRP